MKKHITYILLSCAISFVSAQKKGVGINTENPQTDLDIAGDLNVSQSLYLNDVETSPGKENQILTSGGANEAAAWTDKQIAVGLDESLLMSYMNSFTDRQGVDFDVFSAGHTNPYQPNDLMSSSVGWKEIPGLKSNITLYKSENRINLFFQTMVQFSGHSIGSFACGYFINDNMQNRNEFRLKAVRTDVMFPPSGSFKLFNMNSSIINLPPENYDIKVACIKRNIGLGHKIAIGKPLTNSLNADMSQSSLSVVALESY